MQRAYAEAGLLLFFSMLEGLGMPITGAQTVGRPVNKQSFFNAGGAGNAALLVNPLDAGEIRNVVTSLIENRGKCIELVKNRFLNIQRYSAGNVARLYKKLYYRAMESRK